MAVFHLLLLPRVTKRLTRPPIFFAFCMNVFDFIAGGAGGFTTL
jgi:hypothetical protein